MLINKYVIHVLDNENLILNDYECKFNTNIEKFIEKQVKKIIKHDLLRKGKFKDYENNLVRICSDSINQDEKLFLSNSKEMASYYYELVAGSSESESCDILIASIEIQNRSYIAILKLDYKTLHNHKIDYIDNKFKVDIIENDIAIQSTGIKQAAIIAVNTLETEYDLFVLDVESEKIGESSIFIDEFLNIEKVEDETFKTKKFINITNIWINNSIKDIAYAEEIRTVRNYILKNNSVMDINRFSEEALDYEEDEHFKKFIKSYECDEDFTIDTSIVDKKLKKRKIKTLSGFEISSNLENFEDKMKFKLESNANGSYDLIIKNVEYFYEK